VREGEGPGYRFEKKDDGPWATSGAGPERHPRPLYLFFFSFLPFLFCFLIPFITFANLVQIASNQLCKVSKIQNNNPEQ
jgi:hypothetical protein